MKKLEKRKRRFGSQAILSGEPKGPKLPKSLLFKYFFAFYLPVLSMHPLLTVAVFSLL